MNNVNFDVDTFKSITIGVFAYPDSYYHLQNKKILIEDVPIYNRTR